MHGTIKTIALVAYTTYQLIVSDLWSGNSPNLNACCLQGRGETLATYVHGR